MWYLASKLSERQLNIPHIAFHVDVSLVANSLVTYYSCSKELVLCRVAKNIFFSGHFFEI